MLLWTTISVCRCVEELRAPILLREFQLARVCSVNDLAASAVSHLMPGFLDYMEYNLEYSLNERKL
jgi:hypothetical protein